MIRFWSEKILPFFGNTFPKADATRAEEQAPKEEQLCGGGRGGRPKGLSGFFFGG